MAQILIFALAQETYGLEIARIQEVVAAPRLHVIPRAPRGLLGALNFHGSVVPVLDLGFWLGFSTSRRDPRVIVLAHEACRLALAVEQIRRITPAHAETLVADRAQHGAPCTRAVLELDGEMINLLDLEAVVMSLERLATERHAEAPAIAAQAFPDHSGESDKGGECGA